MNLKRIGATVFVLGLLGFAFGILFDIGACPIPAASCADAGRTFVVTGFDPSSAALQYSNGCGDCSSPVLGGSLIVVVAGALIGGVGAARDVLRSE